MYLIFFYLFTVSQPPDISHFSHCCSLCALSWNNRNGYVSFNYGRLCWRTPRLFFSVLTYMSVVPPILTKINIFFNSTLIFYIFKHECSFNIPPFYFMITKFKFHSAKPPDAFQILKKVNVGSQTYELLLLLDFVILLIAVIETCSLSCFCLIVKFVMSCKIGNPSDVAINYGWICNNV